MTNRPLVALAICTLLGLCAAQAPEPAAKPIDAKATGEAIDAGIGWLLRHQDEAGGWSASQFQRHDPKTDLCTGTGKPDQDLPVTALATFALLARGNTAQVGAHRGAVQKALLWLETEMQADGFVGAPEAGNAVVAHALSCCAFIASSLVLTGAKELSSEAKTSFARLATLRLPDGTWPARLGERKGDPMATCWASLACKSRAAFGAGMVDLEPTLLAMQKGELTAPSPPPVEAMLHWLADHQPGTDARLVELMDTLGRQSPQWRDGREAARMNFLDWNVGIYMMVLAGGAASDQWYAALQQALVVHQRTDGAHAGSWDPVDANGKEGGRVYATSVNVLSLSLGHRLAPDVGRAGGVKK